MTRKPAWHPEDIKAAVRKTGVTLSGLSLASGLSDSACRAALRRPIPAANAAIAKRLGMQLGDLWPRWYDDAGNRVRSLSGHEDNSVRQGGHRQKRLAK